MAMCMPDRAQEDPKLARNVILGQTCVQGLKSESLKGKVIREEVTGDAR
jgi:hypothetical protein